MFGAQGLVSRNTPSGGTTFYAFDERGNVSQRTGGNGAVLSTDLYDGFGKPRSGAADVFGFGGQAGYYTDVETGLVLCTNRHYDPQSGRFLTRDPLGYNGGINLYGYTQNNPVNWMDPDGLQAEDFEEFDPKEDTPEDNPNWEAEHYGFPETEQQREIDKDLDPFRLRTTLSYTPEQFQRLRTLRNLAKSHGWTRRIPYSIEEYGVYDKDGNWSWRIKIRDLPSALNPNAASQIPRFDYRYGIVKGQGLYKNPFTGQTGKSCGSHVPL